LQVVVCRNILEDRTIGKLKLTYPHGLKEERHRKIVDGEDGHVNLRQMLAKRELEPLRYQLEVSWGRWLLLFG